MRRTKIVCTLGPASKSVDIIKKMMLAGMNVARINFSHGTYEEHKVIIDNFKKAREELGLPIPLMLDTNGPEIRIGRFENDKVELSKGQEFTITTKDIIGNQHIVSVNYKSITEDVSVGNKLLLDDGLIELVVKQVTDTDIICEVKQGGTLSNNKSINIPEVEVDLPVMSEKDIADIKFGIENGFDIIAASFIRRAEDVLEIRKVLNNNGGSDLIIIAKIENWAGVKNVDEIIKVSNGIMVARGDLGVEIPIEEVPIIQKKLIEKCYKLGKPVITATQMLDSMIRNPRPTRAEATDIANAIYDGTSAIMLSGETSIGQYPVESVITMAKIAERAEKSIDYKSRFTMTAFEMGINVTNAISHATCATAHDLGATAIIAVTTSGNTARMISKFRPACPIIATTISERIQRQLNLSWGVIPLLAEKKEESLEVFEQSVDIACKNGLLKRGDLIVIAGGIPSGVTGTTNALKVHIVGDILVEGKGIGNSYVTGVLCVAKNSEEAMQKFYEGNILVVPRMSNRLIPLAKKSSGLIIEEETSFYEIMQDLKLNIPIIINAKNATQILKQGTVVTMDAKRGLVHSGVVKIS